jgi:hypothetical protein
MGLHSCLRIQKRIGQSVVILGQLRLLRVIHMNDSNVPEAEVKPGNLKGS